MSDNNQGHANTEQLRELLKDTGSKLRAKVDLVKPQCLQIIEETMLKYQQARQDWEPPLKEASTEAHRENQRAIRAAQTNKQARLDAARAACGAVLLSDPGNDFVAASLEGTIAERKLRPHRQNFNRVSDVIDEIRRLCTEPNCVREEGPAAKWSAGYLVFSICQELKQPHTDKWQSILEAETQEYKRENRYQLEGDDREERLAALKAAEATIEADFQQELQDVRERLRIAEEAIAQKRDAFESAFRPALETLVSEANQLFDMATSVEREEFKQLASLFLNQQIDPPAS